MLILRGRHGAQNYVENNEMIKKLSLLLLVVTFVVAAADTDTPTARVQGATDAIIALVKNQDLEDEVRWGRIADIIDDSFDFQSMSQSVMANNWKKATVVEQEQFVTYFSDHLLKTYREMIESYNNQEIRYAGEKINGNRATVQTVIVLENNKEAPVNYKLRKNDGTWYAYDVEIEGVSLVSKYRTQYSQIVKDDGIAGLLDHVRMSLPTTPELEPPSE